MFYFSPSSLICLGGRAFSFKKDDENIFVVGTESGMIYLGTTQVLALLKGWDGIRDDLSWYYTGTSSS